MSNRQRILFLGHGVGVKFCIDELLKDEKYEVLGLVTHPYEQHQADLEMIESRKDLYGKYAYNVFNLKEDYGIEVFESEDVNSEEAVDWIKEKEPSFIVSIGCRNIIRENFLKRFPDRVINLHTTPLPRYRGAASDSWMILNGLSGTEQYGCCHYIDTGIDSGDIIAREYYRIPESAYPIEVYKARMECIAPLLIKSLYRLNSEERPGEAQDPDEMSVFPRLYTPEDGRISFEGFEGEEVERFIRAFGYPFSGAFCFYGERKLSILKASFHNDQKFHSYCLGLIFGRDSDYNYKVAVRGGYIKILRIEIDSQEVEQRKILRLGKYLQ